MEEPGAQWWFNGSMAAFLGLLASLSEIYRRRIDKINDNYVSKSQLKAEFDALREERALMHSEDLQNFREIRAAIDRVHERIDDLYDK